MTTELPSGTLINNRYLIQRVLGQGGFGRTYLVLDEQRFDEKCVLQEFIFSDSDKIRKAQKLFEREAKTLYLLDHPQLPKFLAWFQDNERFFLVLEYIDGKTYDELLTERLQQNQVFSEGEVIQWLQDLLSALEYIHEHNIIHRDISTDNVMLTIDSSKPMLIDFGAVKYEMAKLQTMLSNRSGNSDETTIAGKQGYSPPEQLRTGECFPNSDLYALAVTTLILLTGKHPQELFDNYSLKWKWRSYISVNELLAQTLDKMLEQEPQKRYQSASEVLEALQELKLSQLSTEMGTPPASPTPISVKLPTPMPWEKILLSSFGGLLLGFVGFAIFSKIQPLCQIFNNCSIESQQEEKYKQLYMQATEQAKGANILFQNAKTLADLENADDSLKKAIAQLETIPENVFIYEKVDNKLSSYQNQLLEINASVDKEKQAQQLLREAEAIANNAIQLTDTAENVSQLEQEKAIWKNAIGKLEIIPEGSLIATRTSALTQEYRDNLKDIERRIQKLEAVQETPESTLPSSQATPNQSPSSSDLPSCDDVLFGECESE